MSAVMAAIFSTGKVSDAGLPAAKEMTFGSDEYLRISRITEGLRVDILCEMG